MEQNNLVQASAAPEEQQEELVRNKYADTMNKKEKKGRKKLKLILVLAVIAAIIFGTVYLVRNILSNENDETMYNGTVFSWRGTLETFVTGYGNIAPKESVTLGKNIKGKVTSLNFAVGDEVHKGDVILVTDPAEIRKELDQARNDLDAANKQLSDVQENIANLTVKAPFAGKIVAVEDVKKGTIVSEGTAFATIADDSVMKLPLYFSYGYEADLKTGMAANVSVPSCMANVSGVVSSVEKIRKVSGDGTVLFKATIDIKNPGTLTKDMEATAVIPSANGDILPSEAGKLEYAREEAITFKAAGEVREIKASEFYSYSSGAVLCSLKNDDYGDSVTSIQRSIQTASERVAELEETIANCQVTSPIDGLITSLLVKEEDELTGADILTISNLESLIVEAQVSEMNISKVEVGMPAAITLEQTDGTYETTGSVIAVSFTAQSNENGGGGMAKFPVTIEIDNADGTLRPGQGVDYRISSSIAEDCIIIDTAAIVYTDEGPAVYAKPAEGQTFETTIPILEGTIVPEGFFLIPVEIGIADDTSTEIVSGLDEGIEVYLASTSMVMDDTMMDGAVMVG